MVSQTDNHDDARLIENLRRRAGEIRAGSKSDITTGLVVQGGGMRGVYSMGALQVLDEYGLAGAFDHLFGASTGALNASCLLAGQCRDAVAAYLDDISTKRFVNWWRWQKVVDVDFLVDEIMTRRRGLRIDRVLASSSTLHVLMTDAVTRRAHVITNRDDPLNWTEVLRATMALPFLYDRAVPLNGRAYIDGCIVEPVPVMRAVAVGCTDILVVLTREPSFRKRPGWLMRNLERPLLRKYPQGIHEVIRADIDLFNSTMDLIERPQQLHDRVRLRAIYPSDMRRMVSSASIDRRRLESCVFMGRDDALRFMDCES